MIGELIDSFFDLADAMKLEPRVSDSWIEREWKRQLDERFAAQQEKQTESVRVRPD